MWSARRVRPPRRPPLTMTRFATLLMMLLMSLFREGTPTISSRNDDHITDDHRLLHLLGHRGGADGAGAVNACGSRLNPRSTNGVHQPMAGTNLIETEAVAGGMAKLPCVIPSDHEKITLIIWFKDRIPSPIYSFDARAGVTLQQGKHWSDEKLLGGRAYFRYSEEPAWLTVENVREADAGLYRCRVDFRSLPTRNTRINLTVLLPPEKLVILDEHGTFLSSPHVILGPRNEGASMNITCLATGGRPPPRVTWWQANALLDYTYETLGDNRVSNVLYMEKLERKHLHMVFTCQAVNNNLTVPLSTAVTIDLNLPALWVRINASKTALSADYKYEIECEAVGARPPPEMTWWKGGVPLRHAVIKETDENGNRTISTLALVPTIEDGGKMLTCRASTPLLPDPEKEDSWKLNILHVPIVSMELGTNLNSSNIREGIDVYFECNIKSNPWVYQVSWRHNGIFINSTTVPGSIISNQSLVLQSVNRNRTGIYTCVGSNSEGDGESNPVFLDVKYPPMCAKNQTHIYGVARGERAQILCELDANPTNVLFTWKFNNTSDVVDMPSNLVAADNLRSMLNYTPMTALDYGTLLCWGRNQLGMQHEPCVFQVTPAGKPDPLHNCSILNQTADSVNVECIEGFDGGLKQHFVLEIYDTDKHSLVRNVESSSPVFSVSGLQSGIGFDISVFATNSKGRSDPVALHAYTLKAAEKHTGPPSDRPSHRPPLRPPPPEQCRVVQQSADALRVACLPGDRGATLVLQAFDARTHRLLGTTTTTSSLRGTPLEPLELRGLPADGRPLLLSVRALTASDASDARTIYARAAKARTPLPPDRRRAASPAIWNITPVFGIVIGAFTALVLVGIIIAVVLRLRRHSGNDTKPKDGSGAEGNGHAKTTDKACSVPLSKDTDESIDSQEEKNPDIIPHNNDTDFQDPDEKAFAKLNNAPNRIYASINPHIHSPSSRIYDNSGNMMNVTKPRNEVTYAELALPKQQPLYVGVPQTPGGVRRQEPTVYAQIDVSKQMPPQQNSQLIPQQYPQPCLQQLTPQHPLQHQLQHPLQHPIHHLQHTTTLQRPQLYSQQHSLHPDMITQDGSSASSSLPLLHHHNLAAAYTPHSHQPTVHLLSPPGPPEQHHAMNSLGPLGPCPPDDDLPACAETPLLPASAQRESTV